MATVIKKQVEVPQPPPPPLTETRYVLELTEKEAKALKIVTGSIGGWSWPGTLRHVTGRIYDALGGGGIKSDDWQSYFDGYPNSVSSDKLL